MGIIGGHPESGLRLELERPRDGGPPWVYEGDAVTLETRYRMRAVVSAEGHVEVDIEGAAREVAERARLIVRAAYKHAKEADAASSPPRKIVRWRATSP